MNKDKRFKLCWFASFFARMIVAFFYCLDSFNTGVSLILIHFLTIGAVIEFLYINFDFYKKPAP